MKRLWNIVNELKVKKLTKKKVILGILALINDIIKLSELDRNGYELQMAGLVLDLRL